MKPYSCDLRQKVINAHNNKQGSQRQLAKRFSVSLSFIQSLLRRYRNNGTVEAKPHGGGQKPKLNNEQLALVELLVESDNDATLVELCEQLEQKTQLICLHILLIFRQLKIVGRRLKNFCDRLRRAGTPSLAARTYEELDPAITNALDAVTKKDIIGWFTHCCYYIAPN